MNDTTREALDETRLQAAADWWARLRDPAAGQDAAAQWLEWSSADARNAEAFERVAELGAQLRGLDADAKASLMAEFAPPVVSAPRAARPSPRSRRWLRHAAAAALAIVAVGGAYYGWAGRVTHQQFASQIAENRSIRLDDGSQVALGGASAFATRFSRGRRDVELQAGEAFFEVAHDAQRPFVVDAGKMSVRAIGTAFNVRRDGERVSIAVAEGRVRIARSGDNANTEAVEAIAGQQVSYDPNAYGLIVRNVDPTRVGTWRERQLDFVDEPLSAVVSSINRYRLHPLRIQGAPVGALSFTGTVRIDNLDGWLNALPQIFPIKVLEAGDAVVLADAGAPAASQ